MSDKIFFRAKPTDKPEAFERAPYPVEPVLQALLADAPEVIAGFTTTNSEPTRLVLIRRELGVPVAGTKGVMRIDHLFADGDGVPVLVEVKRASNYESRREVVAQLLDYAANAATEWTSDVLRAALEARADDSDDAGVEEYLKRHGVSDEIEEFVSKIIGNLAVGKMRLMIVADIIPESLRRIIEFLNQQMGTAEILGVEVPQYIGQHENSVYVPRIVGQTTAAKKTKEAVAGRQWNEATLLEEAVAGDSRDAELVRTLLEEIRNHGTPSWGHGGQAGVGCWYRVDGTEFSAWMLWTGSAKAARIQFPLESLKNSQGERVVSALLQKLSLIPAARDQVALAASARVKVTIPLQELRGADQRSALLAAILLLRGGRPSMAD